MPCAHRNHRPFPQLIHLETVAAELGHRVVRLDTNVTLTEAIGMYRRFGYLEIPAYNDNPYAQLWFEKPLDRGLSDEGTGSGAGIHGD